MKSTEILEKPHRYQEFQKILDQAAGDSAADYDGLGRFWTSLPLRELLEADLHGIRLIAPEKPPVSDCGCGCGSCGTATASRSSRSGLILGLRGLPPFDGLQYPRIPWGGTVVSDADIEMIAEWIDDGAPAEDGGTQVFDVVTGGVTVAGEGYEIYSGSPNEYKHLRGEIKQRMNLDLMTPDQLAELRFAFREVLNLNKWPLDVRNYNNLALIHQNHCQHGWERFLPWHRIYLYEFEQALQDQCPGVTLPYWDWTLPQYPTQQIIPPSFQMFLTEASLANLSLEPGSIPADCIQVIKENLVDVATSFATQSDFFGEVARLIGPQHTTGPSRERFIDALLESNSLWYPLRYPGQFYNPGTKQQSTIEELIHYHFPSPQDMRDIQNLRTFRDFGGGSLYYDSFGFLDQNPHNTLHIWTGGFNPAALNIDPQAAALAAENRNKAPMNISGRRFHKREDLYTQPLNGDMFSNLTASYDPIFWPIHANIDRIWSEWQDEHPQGLPVDLDAIVTPWSYTVRDTLDIHRFGYEYVKGAYVIPVGTGAAVGRFVSKPINVAALSGKPFRQAEVRLHRVPQLPRSCFIRVFLNLPDANAKTPLDHDHYAGYVAVFGHGACFGGPGHCEPPPQRRSYDIRPRSHNTPRNHRVNVTECARRLIENGAGSIRITLVVIGADYLEDHELLRLDSVSLNFLD